MMIDKRLRRQVTEKTEQPTEIVKENDLCVLTTVSEGKPYCSLMSYCAGEEGRTLYPASHKETEK